MQNEKRYSQKTVAYGPWVNENMLIGVRCLAFRNGFTAPLSSTKVLSVFSVLAVAISSR